MSILPQHQGSRGALPTDREICGAGQRDPGGGEIVEQDRSVYSEGSETELKPYDRERVEVLHKQIINVVDAKVALRQLPGFEEVVAKLEQMHKDSLLELRGFAEPTNPVWDLP
jgi:hypothetical protein